VTDSRKKRGSITGLADQGPPRRRRGNAEDHIQAAVVEWVRTVAPHVVAFAVPNGGLRSKSEAAKLKWTGTLAGVPDLVLIAQPGGRAHFIEVKTADGRVEQLTAALLRGRPVDRRCSACFTSLGNSYTRSTPRHRGGNTK
jgi:hypothetical protein